MQLFQESEQKYHWIVENANVAIVVVQEGRLKFFNHKALAAIGYGSQELTSKYVAEFIHPDDWETVIERHLRRLSGEPVPSVYPFRIVGKTGQVKWVESHTVLSTWDGKPATLSFLTDITERRQTEQALRESEERFCRFSEAAFEGIGMIDGDLFIDANRQLAQMLGYELSEMIGMNALDFLAPASRDWVQKLRSSGYEGPYEHIAVRKDGSTFPVEVQAKMLPYKGRMVWVMAIRDISQRKQAEEVIRRRNRELGLLNRIIAASAATPGKDQEIILEVACRELTLAFHLPYAAITLLDQKKTIATVVAEYAVEERLATLPQARPVVDDPLCQYLLSRKTPLVTYVSQPAPDLNLIHTYLRQRGMASLLLAPLVIEDEVVGGLGLEAPEPHTFSTEEINLIWSVADQLAGVLAQMRLKEQRRQLEEQYHHAQKMEAVRIFEPFFTTKERGHGTGLGLATVFGIVKQSGGDIWVYSEEGLGTTFKIYFPHVEEKVMRLSAPPEPKPERPLGWETILLVEDDIGVRELLRQVLPELGYTLLEAGNGQEALRLLAHYPDPIHLLLTDVVMPGISGKTLAEKLLHTRPDLKLLFMSGYTDEAIVQHGVLGGGVAFLQKPFSPVTLAAKLRSVLDNLPDSSIHR